MHFQSHFPVIETSIGLQLLKGCINATPQIKAQEKARAMVAACMAPSLAVHARSPRRGDCVSSAVFLHSMTARRHPPTQIKQ